MSPLTHLSGNYRAVARGGAVAPPLFLSHETLTIQSLILCYPKICKKLCCSTKIVDFTAFFQNFLAARAKYAFFDNVVNQHMHFFDNVAMQHTHFFGIAPPF